LVVVKVALAHFKTATHAISTVPVVTFIQHFDNEGEHDQFECADLGEVESDKDNQTTSVEEKVRDDAVTIV
jgi:hypothetical protein